MTPRINVGTGVSGAVQYVLGPGRDIETGKLKADTDRVDWIAGHGFSFEVANREQADLARKVMEFSAANQVSKTRKCEQDCVHISLSWRPGETPSREDMEKAAHTALESLGMKNARALIVAHTDRDHPHVHVVASKISPKTGRAYDLLASQRKLSAWAEGWEAEHGGIVCTRRVAANELRQAISDRNPDAVLEAMTRRRATFTGPQLGYELRKEIANSSERDAFRKEIVGRAVTLRDGAAVRYTSKAALDAERRILAAAERLAGTVKHEVSDRRRARVLRGERFQGMTEEQARGFRHATGASGLALIDGQAGTGKSYTLAAVREAYEAQGYRVIGLAPTNAVAQDMRADGFKQASTVHSELGRLDHGRAAWNRKTAIIVDEAAMLDTKLMGAITARADEARAKLILVGDDRQLSSIDAGGMFATLKERHGAAELREVKRQNRPDERRAAEWMAAGNFANALAVYERKGRIHWTRTQGEAEARLVRQWAADTAASPDKTRFVFAYTNREVDELNAGLRQIRRMRGDLGDERMLDTAHGLRAFAVGDRVQFTKTDKPAGILNGNAGTITAMDGRKLTVRLDGKKARSITFDAAAFRDFRHGYAGTIYRGQGRTLDQTYLLHSEHWRSASSYVALTRHRESTALFVARPVARDVDQLAKQLGRAEGQQAASRYHVHPAIGWAEAKRQRQEQARATEAEKVAREMQEKIAERERHVAKLAARREETERRAREPDPARDCWQQKAKAGQEQGAGESYLDRWLREAREKPKVEKTEGQRLRHRGPSLGR